MEKFFKSEEDYAKMSSDGKIGLVATIDDEGCPHITFLSSIQPNGQDRVTIGQFCEGLSKRFFTERRKIGFLIFSAQMEIWSGRAEYEKTLTTGPEFDMYNNKPLFRYNSYFGIGKVHFFTLTSLSDKTVLTMGNIVKGALKTRLVAPFHEKSKKKALNPIAKSLFQQIGGLKFISYIDPDGYPVIVPIIQAANAGTDRIVFSATPFKNEIRKIPENCKAAVLFVNLGMESVLAKGTFTKMSGLIRHGQLDIERVYNSMPPFAGYVYPQVPIKKVSEF